MDQFGLQFLELELVALLLRQVADEARENPFAILPRLANREFKRKGRSIAPLSGHDPADPNDPLLAGRAVVLQIGVVAFAIRSGHQARYVGSEQLAFLIAEQSFGRGAE